MVMRRFSQRNSLVTLSDINITPLLDLAFVLLIIFVITTPLLEQGLPLQLPAGVGTPDKKLSRNDIRTVEVSAQGYYELDRRRMTLAQIAERLAQDYRYNHNLLVFIRADKDGRYSLVANILDVCQQIGITRISLRADPHPRS
jgi:biopolymer transport protein ExbD